MYLTKDQLESGTAPTTPHKVKTFAEYMSVISVKYLAKDGANDPGIVGVVSVQENQTADIGGTHAVLWAPDSGNNPARFVLPSQATDIAVASNGKDMYVSGLGPPNVSGFAWKFQFDRSTTPAKFSQSWTKSLSPTAPGGFNQFKEVGVKWPVDVVYLNPECWGIAIMPGDEEIVLACGVGIEPGEGYNGSDPRVTWRSWIPALDHRDGTVKWERHDSFQPGSKDDAAPETASEFVTITGEGILSTLDQDFGVGLMRLAAPAQK